MRPFPTPWGRSVPIRFGHGTRVDSVDLKRSFCCRRTSVLIVADQLLGSFLSCKLTPARMTSYDKGKAVGGLLVTLVMLFLLARELPELYQKLTTTFERIGPALQDGAKVLHTTPQRLSRAMRAAWTAAGKTRPPTAPGMVLATPGGQSLGRVGSLGPGADWGKAGRAWQELAKNPD